MIVIPVLYIPTFYGDVRLERVDAKSTRVIVAKATPLESQALRALTTYAIKKDWMNDIGTGVLESIGTGKSGSFIIGAPLNDIQKQLAKALKPGREVVTVVKFSNGKMEEVAESETKDTSAAPATAPVPAHAEAAAAVAKPVRGCPAPAFAQAELRANRVLEAFLNPQQKEDFRAHNCFMTIGAATGHRYMVTSRHANNQLAKYGGRSFFDLDDDVELCVHDWDVPPAEEMLSLHLLASLPQHELYLRRLEHEDV